MKSGRPKGSQRRQTTHARLSTAFLEMAYAVANARGEPVADTIERAAGKTIERSYRRIQAAQKPGV